MDVEAVLISIAAEGSRNAFEASGVLLDSSLVLAAGTALLPLLQTDREWVSSFVKSSSPRLDANERLNELSFRVLREEEEGGGGGGGGGGTGPKALVSSEGRAVGVWKCPLVEESVDKLFRDWALGHVSHDNEARGLSGDEMDESKELMSILMLLECGDEGELEHRDKTDDSDHVRVLLDLVPRLGEPRRGEEVEVVSTPFGNRHFFNSLSRGVVGNVAGRDKCIVLCDARTVSGCEGGPIFAARRSRAEEREKWKLIGLVTCPLTWWRGEWVGLTIGISLMPVLRRLLRNRVDAFHFAEAFACEYATDGPDPLSLGVVDETVVLVRSAQSWGSGVVLDAAAGTIVTCSHVVGKDGTVSVFHKGKEYPSSVVFRSRDDLAYDLAIIETMKKYAFESEAEFFRDSVEVGETVSAAGYPLFSEKDDLHIRPTVVSGCIARVNPFMIQTTCCIQSGFSGGALFRSGKLLGIIVSNTRNSDAAVFPHINFVIPSSVFIEAVSRYIKTKDVGSLKCLESSDRRVQFLWRLQTSKL